MVRRQLHANNWQSSRVGLAYWSLGQWLTRQWFVVSMSLLSHVMSGHGCHWLGSHCFATASHVATSTTTPTPNRNINRSYDNKRARKCRHPREQENVIVQQTYQVREPFKIPEVARNVGGNAIPRHAMFNRCLRMLFNVINGTVVTTSVKKCTAVTTDGRQVASPVSQTRRSCRDR